MNTDSKGVFRNIFLSLVLRGLNLQFNRLDEIIG